ncbi:MAG: zinc-ribbon domain-containing protein [Thermoplasmata archaeon]
MASGPRFCPSCGAALQSGHTFCPNCGRPVA